MNNVSPIRGHRPCVHCGQPVLNHILAMTEKRCPDRSGRHFEPQPIRATTKRTTSQAFDAEETAAMQQLFETLLRGGDVTALVRRGAVVSVMRKFQSMRERTGT